MPGAAEPALHQDAREFTEMRSRAGITPAEVTQMLSELRPTGVLSPPITTMPLSVT